MTPFQQNDPATIRAMFAGIADWYDVNNRLHSLGRDRAWRRAAVRMAAVRPGEAALDVACGTGAMARLLQAAGAGRVVGADFCEEMLHLARTKSADGKAAAIEFLQADAHALPVPGGAFDLVTVAFGLRNLADPRAALREFRRVLKPGGRLIVLEFCPAAPGWGGAFIRWFTRAVMPRTAGVLSGHAEAYRYLHASTQSFLRAEEVAAAMRDAGFANLLTRTMTFGTVAAHRGERIEAVDRRL